MSIKNLSYLNKLLVCFIFCLPISKAQNIANYIGNGSFEELYNCGMPIMFQKLKYWRTMDSASYGNCLLANSCYSNMPSTYFGFQTARTGNGFALYDSYCLSVCSPTNNRGYIRNRLKSKLIMGKIYCVKFYICVPEGSSASIDAHGACFSDNSLDTITKFKIPLTYLSPQVQNSTSNIIGDTLNWIPVTGTFVANGTEKHCVIGNFKSDATTNYTIQSHNPTHITQFGVCSSCTTSVVYIDDVSCIPIDLPAQAGADIFGIPNNTVYIGRARDVGIDEACMWYNLTNTTVPIANAAGITVTVATTTQSYMVKQDICGVIKYDTVVVFASAVGINPNVSLSEVENGVKIYPNPAKDVLNLQVEGIKNYTIKLINALGQTIKEVEVKNYKTTIDVNELQAGFYFIEIKTEVGILTKKIVIEK